MSSATSTWSPRRAPWPDAADPDWRDPSARILAIDPAGFLGAEAAQHLQRAEALFEGITGQGARLPGQRRFEARAKSLAHGVDIPRALYDDIQALRP